jgi:hypothetical protein
MAAGESYGFSQYRSIKPFAKPRRKCSLLSRHPLLHDGDDPSKNPMQGFKTVRSYLSSGWGLTNVGQLAAASNSVTHRTSSMMPGLDELRLGGADCADRL